MIKFVGFDVEGEIWNEVVLDYHIVEIGFRSSAQLSANRWASGQWWCIVIVVNDGGAAHMYWRNKVRWGVIIINDATSSVRCPMGCIEGQDGLSMDSWIPHMDWFLVGVRVI